MTENSHGGKRSGAGRPKGSVKINSELQQQFREHSQTALNSIVSIAEDPEHQHHLKACEIILQRGYGNSTATPEADEIISQFIAGEITAINAGLLMESKGLKVGSMLSKYISREYDIAAKGQPIFDNYEKLPTS